MGGMDRKLGNKAAAAHLGIADTTWRAYVARGQTPQPDGQDEVYGQNYWLESTLTTWKKTRQGPGNRTPRKKPADE